ncbi:hypothetical protein K9L05_02600 [Candidatus Babeliales bacterium]|nr:hypothetical protein [Candidatus Babeliales bacterium]MCF7899516.1 hypothetical protein [Candidatus Babeliales bacterium]
MNKFFLIKNIVIFCLIIRSISAGIGFANGKLIIKTENFYSKKLEKEIASFFKKNINSEKISKDKLNSFCLQLKKKYKIIKKIELNSINPDNIECKITAAQPLFTVNNKFVLTDKKRLFDCEFFEFFDRKKINNFFIQESFLKEKMSVKIYNCLKNISKEIINDYDINYIKDTQVLLKSKNFDCNNTNNNNFFILLDSNSVDLNKIKKIESIKKANLNFNLNKKRWKKCKLFDLRFNNRILLKFVDLDFGGGDYGIKNVG